ncbi:MAG TPA: GxxExxY protein [Sedimentisphaerales bacterium]|nr:GxxExxY protein [Sedimentisphaerales bacterium]
MMNENPNFSELSNKVIGCAIEVHRALGPGLLESAYQQCLAHELRLNNIDFHVEKPVPVNYKGCRLDCGYRIDILVEDQIILELKSVEKLKPIHEAQILCLYETGQYKTGFSHKL